MTTILKETVSSRSESDLDATTAHIAYDAVENFMRRTGLYSKKFRHDPDPEVEKRVRQEIAGWNVGTTSPDLYEKHIVTGVHVATMFYSYCHTDIQVLTALYSFLIAMTDDFDVSTEAMEEFSSRLCTGQEQLHPVLDRMAMILGRMPQYYSPYAAQSIVVSTIQFINATAFDKNTETMTPCEGAQSFVDYKRLRSGIGEAYGFFAFDKFTFPDISTHVQVIAESIFWLSYINDIFSFYKEELVGECNNYVHDRAIVSKKSIPVVFSELVHESIASVDRARQILQGAREREAYETFLTGYVYFHLLTPRYRAKEFLGEQYL